MISRYLKLWGGGEEKITVVCVQSDEQSFSLVSVKNVVLIRDLNKITYQKMIADRPLQNYNFFFFLIINCSQILNEH